jgi:hypothetical protein
MLRGSLAQITIEKKHGVLQKEPKMFGLKVDNQSAIALIKIPVFHERSKHIETCYHYIRECQKLRS